MKPKARPLARVLAALYLYGDELLIWLVAFVVTLLVLAWAGVFDGLVGR